MEEAVVEQLEEEGEQVEAEDDGQLEVLVALLLLVEVWLREELGSEHD